MGHLTNQGRVLPGTSWRGRGQPGVSGGRLTWPLLGGHALGLCRSAHTALWPEAHPAAGACTHRCGQITWNPGICFVMLLLAVAVLVRIYDLFLTTSMGLVNTQAAEAESPPAITSMSL